MRTLLLLSPLITSLACVTIDGPRRLVSQQLVETRCEPGRPTAVLDSTVRDRVRLVFARTEYCAQTWETSYLKEQRWRLSNTARGVLAAGAGLIVAAPLYAVTVTAASPRVGPAVDGSLERPQPSYSPVPGALAEPILYAIMFASIGVGAAAYEAMKGSDPRPAIEVSERTVSHQARELLVRDGTVSAPGLEVSGLKLGAGALDLSLEEAQGLAPGVLYLDGARVELVGEARERLSFLPICKRAVDAGGSDFEAWNDPQRAEPWKLAEACDRRGWTFAEDVRVNAIRRKP